MEKNKPQVQYSLHEQLEELRTILSLAGISHTQITDSDRASVIKLANRNGLYDAADYVSKYQRAN